jgi:thiamine kinase-like enzyme
MPERTPAPADPPFAETLGGVIGGVLGQDAPLESWVRLSGGLSNSSFRVRACGRDYVVRLPGPGREHTLGASAELRVMRAVASAGIGPPVVGIDAGSGALVTEYLHDASHWHSADARAPGNIERAAALLRRLHRLPADPVADHLPAYAPAAAAATYIGRAGGRAGLDRTDRRLADELERLARDFERRDAEHVLCHNDLVASNILDGGTLVLVDFEYAVGATPVLDLASLAAMNAFGADERAALLEAYFADEHDRCDASELDEAVRMLRLIAYFWARALARETGDAASYAEFTNRSALMEGSE